MPSWPVGKQKSYPRQNEVVNAAPLQPGTQHSAESSPQFYSHTSVIELTAYVVDLKGTGGKIKSNADR
jgi:hypothetical protein